MNSGLELWSSPPYTSAPPTFRFPPNLSSSLPSTAAPSSGDFLYSAPFLDDRENSLNNRGNDFDCLELAGFVRTLFLKLGWVLTPLQAWNIDPACEHRNAGGGRDMVLAIRMGGWRGPSQLIPMIGVAHPSLLPLVQALFK